MGTGITKISKYQTTDNREFTDEQAARQHQLRIDSVKEILDSAGPVASALNPTAFIRGILGDEEAIFGVRDALNKFIRRSGIKKPEKAEARKVA